MTCPSCGHENIEGTDRCDNCMTSLLKLDSGQPETAVGLARSVMENNLVQLEQELAVLVQLETPAIDVVRKMRESRAGCALVLDGAKLAGIFTEHDVLNKLTGDNARSVTIPVRELMSAQPETLRDTDSVAEALNKMSMGRYRHIPITRDDGSYSVTSIKTVLQYIAREDW
ncbi:MAG TPA: CBS domain-containing protein [Pyrinomonadaceae bacterium]|nr:CBS domain-containing protein [Pyrinomonadaceae bacterium]